MVFKKNSKQKVSIMDLESQEPKTKLSINKQRENSRKPLTMTGLKIARIFIWAFIVIVLLVGVLQMVRSKQTRIVKNVVQYDFAPSENETARAYAATFTKEYLTYDNAKQDDYINRISPFVIDAVKSGVKIESSKGSSKVIDVVPWKVDKLDDKHSNITVRAVVQTTNNVDMIDNPNSTGQQGKVPKVETKIIYLSVPIGYFNGGYIVDDYPSFCPQPKKIDDPKEDDYKGGELVLDNVKQEISGVLTNFFKTYSTGTEGQISYYMDNGKSIKGYEGQYTFDSIQSLEVYKDSKDKNKVTAIVQVMMDDSSLGTEFTQRYVIKLVNKQDNGAQKWYIADFVARGNIYGNGEEKD